MLNVPNTLSLLRLLLIPVFVVVLFSGVPGAYYYAAGIFLLASLTDILDGYIARKYNQITKLGRFLDPAADKLMKVTAMICLTVLGIVPVWVIIALFAKELLMLCGGMLFYRRVSDFPTSNLFGKAAEFFLCALVLAHILFPIPAPVSLILWCVAIAAEYFAMTVYAVRTLRGFKQDKA